MPGNRSREKVCPRPSASTQGVKSQICCSHQPRTFPVWGLCSLSFPSGTAGFPRHKGWVLCLRPLTPDLWMEVCIWSLRPLSVRQTSLLSSLQIPSLHPCLTHYALFDLSRPDLFSRNGLGQWEKCEASNSVPSCLRGLADKMPNPALWSAWL